MFVSSALPHEADATCGAMTEWVRQEIECDSHTSDASSVAFYHGTIAHCAHAIVSGGAFIPGPHGYSKGRRHYKGCFGSLSFWTASYRGDQTRWLEADGIYSFQSCPCVLELSAQHALLRNCSFFSILISSCCRVPGIEGAALPGLQVKAIHWNMRFVCNYRKLHDPQIRERIVDAGGILACCCGGHRQKHVFQSCGDCTFHPWEKFVKIGKRRCCPECLSRWR